jgi:hypothetical protein
MKWVNRKTKLPPKTDLYIVYTKTNRVCEAYWIADKFKFQKRWGDEIRNVTHWMNMPKPPKKKGV